MGERAGCLEGGGAKGFFEESLEKFTHMAHKHAQYEEKSKERARLLCRLQLGPETEGQQKERGKSAEEGGV